MVKSGSVEASAKPPASRKFCTEPTTGFRLDGAIVDHWARRAAEWSGDMSDAGSPSTVAATRSLVTPEERPLQILGT